MATSNFTLFIQAADELTAIMVASRISASRNSKQSAIANRKSAI